MLIRRDACRILLRQLPNDVDAMTLRALALFLEAKPSEALTQVVGVLKLDPDNEKAKALRSRVKEVVRLQGSGNEAFQRDEYQTAIASWADALAVSQDDTWFRCTATEFRDIGTWRARQ